MAYLSLSVAPVHLQRVPLQPGMRLCVRSRLHIALFQALQQRAEELERQVAENKQKLLDLAQQPQQQAEATGDQTQQRLIEARDGPTDGPPTAAQASTESAALRQQLAARDAELSQLETHLADVDDQLQAAQVLVNGWHMDLLA